MNSTNHKDISSALRLRYAKIIGENAIEKNEDLYFFLVDNTSVDVEKFKDVSARTEKRILTDKLKLMVSRSDEDQDPVSYLATGLLSKVDDVCDTAMSISMECGICI